MIKAVVFDKTGTITEGNDKVVVNEEEKRFLEPPYDDEWYKVI